MRLLPPPSLPLGSAGVGGPLSPGTQGPAYTIWQGPPSNTFAAPPHPTPAPQSSFWLPALAMHTPPPAPDLFHGSPGPPGQSPRPRSASYAQAASPLFPALGSTEPPPGHPYPLSDTRLRPLPSQAGAQMPPPPGSSIVPVPPSLGPQQGLLTKQGVSRG